MKDKTPITSEIDSILDQLNINSNIDGYGYSKLNDAIERLEAKHKEDIEKAIETLFYVERTINKEQINDYFDMKIIVKSIKALQR